MLNRKKTGEFGERYALMLLKNKGYKIISKNYSTRFGEIDIIAVDGDTTVFIEVKTRKSTKFGKPEESVIRKKIENISNIALQFLRKYPNLPQKLRIDVVSIEIDNGKILSSKIIKVI